MNPNCCSVSAGRVNGQQFATALVVTTSKGNNLSNKCVFQLLMKLDLSNKHYPAETGASGI